MRVAGVEPALLAELDFESSASTNSTTPAHTPPAIDTPGAVPAFGGQERSGLYGQPLPRQLPGSSSRRTLPVCCDIPHRAGHCAASKISLDRPR